jgi:NAD dependent epimerase/dehydratase family enzyme
VKIIRFAIDHRELLGPVNVIAPEQVTMQRFCAALGHALHRPSWLRVPEQFLKVMLGEMAGMFLGGQPVVPAKLSALGYSFQFPTLESALKEIYRSCRPH